MSYEFSEISGHTVVKSRKTVKYAKNTICDTFAWNSWSYEFIDISAPTLVRSRKAVK